MALWMEIGRGAAAKVEPRREDMELILAEFDLRQDDLCPPWNCDVLRFRRMSLFLKWNLQGGVFHLLSKRGWLAVWDMLPGSQNDVEAIDQVARSMGAFFSRLVGEDLLEPLPPFDPGPPVSEEEALRYAERHASVDTIEKFFKVEEA